MEQIEGREQNPHLIYDQNWRFSYPTYDLNF